MATSLSTPRSSWQQVLSNWQTVPAAHVSQAAEVIRGLAGSWTASYQLEDSSRDNKRSNDAGIPSPQVKKVLKLGQPGFPEINFAPYNWGTNRFGSKGGSFLGHPISFSVVGPTAKNPVVNGWQWVVTDNSAVPGTGDVLSAATGSGFLATTVVDYYGIPNGNVATPGGLYLVVSQTGEAGTLTGSLSGGIGDGCVLDEAVPNGYTGVGALTDAAKFEIFRVVSATDATVTLDPSKRLADYFSIPVGPDIPVIKSVTFIKPEATRLVAVPGTSTGGAKDSQAFAVVPPRRALGTDEKVTLDQWTSALWNEPALSFDWGAGTPESYQMNPLLPIPRPLGQWHGRLMGIDPVTGLSEVLPSPVSAGGFILADAPSPGWTDSLEGKIIKIHTITTVEGAEMLSDGAYQASLNSLLGCFEVISDTLTPGFRLMRRMEECDLNTGFSRTGAFEYFTVDPSVPLSDKGIFVDATVHEPVTALWATRHNDIDKLQSARLTNLINPQWVERKSSGGTPDRADKAVFDTSSTGTDFSNPGSLLDLGFRMVLFPAKIGSEFDPLGGPDIEILIPDWDNPVDSSSLVLDPSLPDENQFLEVDYSNGLVQFSHPIKSGSPLYPSDAAVFTSTDNVRGEMVLFACCVPYSMEEGQLGTGVRVTGGDVYGLDVGYGGDTAPTKDTVDVFSGRLVIPAYGVQAVDSTHTVDTANLVQVILEGYWQTQIPQVGFFELLTGDTNYTGNVTGGPVIEHIGEYRGSLFGYTSVVDMNTLDPAVPVNQLTVLQGVFGGGVYGVDSFTSAWNSDYNWADNPAVVVIRREVVTPNDLQGVAGVPYQFDTTYGAAKRAGSLRFDDADVVSGADGSVIVRAKGTQAGSIQDTLQTVMSSSVLEKGTLTVMPGTGPFDVVVGEHVILMRGRRVVVPESYIRIPDVQGVYYIYNQANDGKSSPLLKYTQVLPLYFPEDVLLAKAEVPFVTASCSVTDLQYPTQKVDQKVVLYVGELGWRADPGAVAPVDQWQSYEPHFPTLWQAVEYANNLMAPDSGISQPVTIKVVGRTFEPDAHLPIQIGVNGLVIEGIPQYDTNPASTALGTEISWGETAPFNENLIDLNSCTDLVFRNLSFRSQCPDTVTFGGSTAAVFTSSGTPSGITIENCRCTGIIQNFVAVTAGTLQSSRIANNIVEGLAGSGFSCVVNTVMVHNVEIVGNSFTGAMSRTNAGIEMHCLTSPTALFMDSNVLHSNVIIRGNRLVTFTRGIWAATRSGVIEDNFILTSAAEGMVTAGGWEIRNNHLSNIYTGAILNLFDGVHTPSKHGIRHYSNHQTLGVLVDSVFVGKIQGNRIEMEATGADPTLDKAILVSGSPNVVEVVQATGTAAAGGASTVTLDGSASAENDFYVGCVVSFTNDSPVGVVSSTGTVTAYDGGTKIATVSAPWATAPDNTSEYRVARRDRLGTAFHEIVEGNDVSYLPGLSSRLDRPVIRVDAVGAKVSGNVCNILEVWGTDNTVSENQTTQLGINWDVYEDTWNPAATASDRNMVQGNKVSIKAFLWTGTTSTSNLFDTTGCVTYVRDDCKLANNYIANLQDFDGVGIGPVTGASARLVLTGNQIGQVGPGGLDFDLDVTGPFEFTGNRFDSNLWVPDVSAGVFGDNTIDGSFLLGATVVSTNFTVSGNRVTGSMTVGQAGFVSDGATITGNHPHTELVVYGDNASVTGNNLRDTGVSYGTLEVIGNRNNLSGNVCGDLVVEGAGNVIQGNRMLGDLTLTAGGPNTYNVVANNSADPTANTLYVNTNYTVLTGNVFQNITFANNLTGAMISGNMVTGDVTLGDAVGTQTTEVVLNGNWISGSVLPDLVAPSSIIAMGNKAAKIMNTAVTVGKVVNTADNSDV